MILLIGLGLLFAGGLVYISAKNDRASFGELGFLVIMRLALAGFITMEVSKSAKSQIVTEKLNITTLSDK